LYKTNELERIKQETIMESISTLGFLFGLMGVSLGTWGVFFGILCLGRIGKLTK